MAKLFATKSINTLMGESQETGEHSLKRTLGPVNLIMLGIGAIIGAGLFVRTAAAIADRSGPSVTLAFVVAGFGCAFAGLCYAEFASMIPVAGSAYTYSYATMGELIAWIIGWDLVWSTRLVQRRSPSPGANTSTVCWTGLVYEFRTSGVIRHSKRPWTQASAELLIFPPYSFCFFSRRSLSKGPKNRPSSTVLS